MTQKIFDFPLPETTSIGHAVRWIYNQRPFLNMEARSALSDYTTIPDPIIWEQKQELLLALWHGTIESKGMLDISTVGTPGFDKTTFDPNHNWTEFLQQSEQPETINEMAFLGTLNKMNIPKRLWKLDYVDWDSDKLAYPGDGEIQAVFSDIELQTSGLLKHFPPDDIKDKTIPLKKGRSQIYDWDGFFVEIAVLADLDSLPETQAGLEQKMADWCLINWGKEPSETSIRNKVSPIYNHSRKVKK